MNRPMDPKKLPIPPARPVEEDEDEEIGFATDGAPD